MPRPKKKRRLEASQAAEASQMDSGSSNNLRRSPRRSGANRSQESSSPSPIGKIATSVKETEKKTPVADKKGTKKAAKCRTGKSTAALKRKSTVEMRRQFSADDDTGTLHNKPQEVASSNTNSSTEPQSEKPGSVAVREGQALEGFPVVEPTRHGGKIRTKAVTTEVLRPESVASSEPKPQEQNIGLVEEAESAMTAAISENSNDVPNSQDSVKIPGISTVLSSRTIPGNPESVIEKWTRELEKVIEHKPMDQSKEDQSAREIINAENALTHHEYTSFPKEVTRNYDQGEQEAVQQSTNNNKHVHLMRDTAQPEIGSISSSDSQSPVASTLNPSSQTVAINSTCSIKDILSAAASVLQDDSQQSDNSSPSENNIGVNASSNEVHLQNSFGLEVVRDAPASAQKPGEGVYISDCVTIQAIGDLGQSEGQPVTWIVDNEGQLTTSAVVAKAAPTSNAYPIISRSTIPVRGQEGSGITNKDQQSPTAETSSSPAKAMGAVGDSNVDPASEPGCQQYCYTDQEGNIRCKMCNYRTPKMANFYKHKRVHLGNTRRYQCNVCGHESTTSSNLVRHKLKHSQERKFSCEKCDKKFFQKIHLAKHIQYVHTTKAVQCPMCDYRCSTLDSDLRRHMDRRHKKEKSEPKQISCSECGFVASGKQALNQHKKFHKPGPELKLFCESCDFVSDCQSRLNRHQLTHTAERPYACGLCSYRSNQKDHVVRHMQSVHKLNVLRGGKKKTQRKEEVALKEGDTSQGQPAKTKDQAFLCNYCKYVSSQKDDVVQHMQKEHTLTEARLEVGKNSGPELLRTTKKVYLPADFRDKEKIHACTLCTMRFSKALNLYKHLHLQHPAERKGLELTCSVCAFEAPAWKNLVLHMRRHNATAQSKAGSGSKQATFFSCIICEFKSHERQLVYSHMSSTHNMQILTRRDGSVYFVVLDAGSGDAGPSATVITSTSVPEVEEGADVTSESIVVDPAVEMSEVYDAGSPEMDDVVSQQGQDVTVDGAVVQDCNVVPIPPQEEVLSPEQLSNLTSGDYVEINGEVYKVEVSNNELLTTGEGIEGTSELQD